jgi:microcystin-dependent protein
MPITSNDYIGSIMMAGFNFPPNGYAFCNGQTLAISSNAALFSLLGTTFGGNGTSNFQLPNLQGRTPLHFNGSFPLGLSSGAENVTLNTTQMPSHTHSISNVTISAATGGAATQASPVGGFLASNGTDTDRFGTGADEHMATNTLGSMAAGGTYQTQSDGSGFPFGNTMPFAVINFCISLVGIFPSR